MPRAPQNKQNETQKKSAAFPLIHQHRAPHAALKDDTV